MSVFGFPVVASTVIGSHRPRCRCGRVERAAAILLVLDDLVAEVLDGRGDRHWYGVAERAERPAHDVAAHVENRLQVGVGALALLEPLQGPHHPVGALAAWRALATGL